MMNREFPLYTKNNSLKIHNKGHYYFYHKSSYPTEAPSYYQNILGNAKSSIDIFDPYFNVIGNNCDQNIFRNIPKEITLKILTVKGLDRRSSYLGDVDNAIKSVIPTIKNVRFGMRVINKSDMSLVDYQIHDRFLIIDKKTAYVVGSSIGYHLSPILSTGIYEVQDDVTNNFVIEIFEEYWKIAINNELPVRYI